jgi:HAD superfamily hydrolase (TIGR01509 family)
MARYLFAANTDLRFVHMPGNHDSPTLNPIVPLATPIERKIGITMPIAAIVFDMDGILVDTEKYWQQARIELANSVGQEWTQDDQRFLMGSNTREWVAYTQQRLKLDNMSFEQVEAAVKDRLLGYYETHLPIMPGAVEAVQLAATHYPIALASGSSHWAINAIMRLTGLGQTFKVLVSADEVSRGKPAPDVFLEAARRLGVPPQDMVGIEDSGNGIRALRGAGMRVIAVPTVEIPLTAETEAMADVILPTLEAFNLELLETLK